MRTLHRINTQGKDIDVRDFDTHVQMDSSECVSRLERNLALLQESQERLYADGKQSLLVVFQAMDAAGKDSTIRAVFSGMNPQGFLVSSFKQPSLRELAHDYLWRVNRQLPSRGHIGVFNRSHYEEVLVCKVHPEYITYQDLPGINDVSDITEQFWTDRYRQINNFEKYLAENGCTIIKFFLHVSQDEQKKRLLSRMDTLDKNWKFSLGDINERQLWDEYMDAYSKAITKTSKDHAPWYIVPADDKDYLRAAVSDIIRDTLVEMDPKFPQVGEKELQDIEKARVILAQEQTHKA